MLVVFASLNADLVFRVDALPQPKETRLCPSYSVCGGGKGGNQALAAARAGADVTLVGAVGRDAFAEVALGDLQAAGVRLQVQRLEAPTACASIYVDDGAENMIVVASGANRQLRAEHCPDALLAQGGLLVTQMETPETATWEVVRRAHARGCRTLVNLAPMRPVPNDAWEAIDTLVVNEVEAAALGEHLGLSASEPLGLARQVAARGRLACVVTLGSQGCIAAWGDSAVQVPVLALGGEPVDTTGAGDAFVGALAMALDAGQALPEALRVGSAASGLTCMKAGTQPSMPQRDAIEAALRRLGPNRAL